jgi:hypothetical protein
MIESEFILLGTERELRRRALGAAWRERMAALAVAKPPLRGLRQGSAQWLRPELRVRVRHLKAKGTLRHATVKGVITD